MHEYNVYLTKPSKRDIAGIYSYVKDMSSEWDAKVVTSDIQRKIASLKTAPERVEPFGKDKRGRALLTVICGKYRIIYSVNRQESKVIIFRVLSVARDFNRLFD